jgi:phage tail-like protein
MSNEFKFRALTSEDWKGIKDDTLSYDDGLRLKDNKNDGFYPSKPLDSGISRCHWHRIVIDAYIPVNSTLTISFYTSETEETTNNWTDVIIFKENKDALIQVPNGRYLTLKIDFHREEGVETPVLKQVKVYYPRLSYLRYLPAVYQENAESKEFLERFLSIFESSLYDSEETISRLPMYFDPMAALEDFVPWLASWLSLDLYELLGDRNREFILRATEFYKQKGTVSGLASFVTFLTGKRCCVKEYMNNVFRSYGMEHEEETENIDISTCKKNIEKSEPACTKFDRRTSLTVDTTNSDLLANMGKYCDEVHYVVDTSQSGRYFPNVIGIFIILPLGDKLEVDKEDLHKIINSFLPVFVRAEINIV